jgi:molybdate transport system substrate-binding protein
LLALFDTLVYRLTADLTVRDSSGVFPLSEAASHLSKWWEPALKLATIIAACLSALSTVAFGADLRLYSVGAMGAALKELVPSYERETGNHVQTVLDSPATIIGRLQKGEQADVVIMVTAAWDQAVKTGRLNVEQRTTLGVTHFAVGVKAGSDYSSFSTVAEFQHLIEGAKSIALVDASPANPPLMAGLDKLGLASQVEAKTKYYPNGGALAEALAHSEVDLGITIMSELKSHPGVTVLGVVPHDVLPLAAVSVATTTNDSSQPDAARRLIQFLSTPAAKTTLKARGVDPD